MWITFEFWQGLTLGLSLWIGWSLGGISVKRWKRARNHMQHRVVE